MNTSAELETLDFERTALRAERDELIAALRGLIIALEPIEYDDDFGASRYGGPDPDAPRKAYWQRPEVRRALAVLDKVEGCS